MRIPAYRPGAALPAGLAHIAAVFPGFGVVTADADGQHLAEDVLRVGGRLAGNGFVDVDGVRVLGE